jgi:hypothetical protein
MYLLPLVGTLEDLHPVAPEPHPVHLPDRLDYGRHIALIEGHVFLPVALSPGPLLYSGGVNNSSNYQCCGSEFFPSRIRIFPISDPGSKNLSILTQKIVSSSRKYDPSCSSRIRRILTFYPSRVPEIKKAPDPGSGYLVSLRPGSRSAFLQ